jgi:hypothetical protein
MKTTSPVRRFAASALLTAGLAYPACAAVCPKGRGSCPSPGRCFLFVDADGNSLCDYTSRTGSQTASGAYPPSPGTPASAQTAVQTNTIPVPDPTAAGISTTTATTQGQNTSAIAIQSQTSGGFLDSIHLSPVIAEIILFFILTGIFFALFRTGVLGIPIRKTMPALMLSSFFALGLSLITTSFLAGDTGAGTMYALVYISGTRES